MRACAVILLGVMALCTVFVIMDDCLLHLMHQQNSSTFCHCRHNIIDTIRLSATA